MIKKLAPLTGHWHEGHKSELPHFRISRPWLIASVEESTVTLLVPFGKVAVGTNTRTVATQPSSPAPSPTTSSLAAIFGLVSSPRLESDSHAIWASFAVEKGEAGRRGKEQVEMRSDDHS